MSLKVALISLLVVLMGLAVLLVGWGFLGVKTGIWIDGCPDVVAAYIETHGAAPLWWKELYLWAVPPALCLVAFFVGQRTYRFLSARPNSSSKRTGGKAPPAA